MNLNNLSKEELIIELSILRENEANLAAIFHVIDESVILISSDETILAINDTAAKRLNSTPALLKGQNVFALLPIDVVEHRRPFILQVKEIGETVIFQDQRNGKWLENRISPITDHSGKVTRMAIFARDITEKRESEAAIIAAEAIESDLLRKINDAQHTAKIGSWDWNLITNEVWWSDELYHIFDLDVDKFTPSVESNAKYVHPEDCEKYHEEANRVIQTKGELNYDLRIITAKGQLKHCNSRARIECDSAGNPNLLLGTFSDITERKLREEALSQALAEREKFFSIIAHDLRSPFNGLLGLTQVLAEELPTMRLDQIMNIVSMLRNSAKNVYSLVENLLEWSCMRRGITIFSPQEFFLSPNMKGFLHPVIEQANKKGIKITCNISENLLVFGDMNMVSSTIRNLATNAVKFTHKGGIVVISARTTIWNTVEICVKDNGIGMSNVMIDKIFYLHENTHRKGTNDEPSSGLGLILCKEFVEKHGGKIRIESKEGKGSKFIFTLPLLAENKEHQSFQKVNTSEIEDNQVTKLKILIVDDDETSSQLLAIGVRKFAKEIIQIRTGKEALQICHNHPDIDLVLMDIQLPEMDGYETTLNIRQFNPKVIIIAHTALIRTDEREKAIAAKCNDFMEKPIKMTLLVALIQKYFKI